MARHPGDADPLVVPRPVAARVFGVTPGGFDKWLDEHPPIPTMVVGGPGKAAQYSIPDCVAWFVRRLEAKHGGPGLNPIEERARKERAQAQLAEQTFKARSRELLSAAEVEQGWAVFVMAAKMTLLAWQTTLADKVYRAGTLDGVAGVEKALKDAVRDVLRALAAGGPVAPGEDGPA